MLVSPGFLHRTQKFAKYMQVSKRRHAYLYRINGVQACGKCGSILPGTGRKLLCQVDLASSSPQFYYTEFRELLAFPPGMTVPTACTVV